MIVNLEGDLAHPHLLGLLHARDPELEVEIEVLELDDQWFDREVSETHEPERPLRDGILRQALRFLVGRRRDER